ncbi:biotin synthase auxiliary protein BsaP [Janibacter massiliensis]|uniref:biotin synthase auxiliary protein BsaP n=1 Tax=Janibacter massiliensis TaxID=2058291 RepID=UPI000D114E2E|nr:hypothetical protein [Janibacter massiliensis]
MTQQHDAPYCTRCGEPEATGDHGACERWLASEEPPRFCPRCRRRMKVQVVPLGWSATCSVHGTERQDPA